MRRVYLDQNKWIDLSRAAYGRSDGQRFQDALTIARAGVEQGLVSFPLSSVHYMELGVIQDLERRRRLARVMRELSKFHTMASQTEIVPAEFDHAIRDLMGPRPTPAREIRPFGFGIGFAFGIEDVLKIPEKILPEQRDAFRNIAESIVLFGGDAPGVTPVPIDVLRKPSLDYAQAQDAVLEMFKTEGYDKGDKLRRAVLARSMVDVLDPYNEALRRAAVPDWALPDSPEALDDLLHRVSSQWVLAEFVRSQFAQQKQGHHP